jgi:electron transport complex protein RnfC
MGYSCIGCGRCTDVCPEGLSPYYIYKVVQSKRRRNLDLFDADRCTGCGTCSYICPAKLDLAQVVQRAARLRQDGQGGDL